MKPVSRVEIPEGSSMTAPGLRKILTLLNADGLNARMVGGCVRDLLLKRDVVDIDLACSLPPEETMARLKRGGVKVVPTGLKHGTITAVVDKIGYEVTTLRYDVETDGRHATVAFTDDWAGDAARRDFTFNALYLDGDGSLYDPCAGLADLAARRVRFIGAADDRIGEDALRILRFFRFAAQIGGGVMDATGFDACVRHKAMLDGLSGERLAQEIFKILKAENLLPVMAEMVEEDFLPHILSVAPDWVHFKRYVTLEQSLGRCEPLARLCSLLPPGKENATRVARHLRLSNQQAKQLTRYHRHDVVIPPDIPDQDLRQAIYLQGRDVVIFALLDQFSGKAPSRKLTDLLNYVEAWPVPVFPLQGRDLMKAGRAQGPEVGAILKKREADWIASDFSLTKQDLLQ